MKRRDSRSQRKMGKPMHAFALHTGCNARAKSDSDPLLGDAVTLSRWHSKGYTLRLGNGGMVTLGLKSGPLAMKIACMSGSVLSQPWSPLTPP